TATLWNIEYGLAGFTQGTGTAIQGINTNPYTLTMLTPCTNYEYYVQADCGGGNLSAFVGPFAFTTAAAPATGTDTQVACETFTWIDGMTYTTSNNTATFTIVGGGSSVCGNDSIVTLDLTINNASTGTDMQVACETYTWIDGMTYTADNNTATFTIVGGAANGCDSIVTLDLTIEQGSDAGMDNADTKCLNEPVDLATYLSAGADVGGTWLNPVNSPLASSMTTVSNQPGVYVYSYVTAATGACQADTAYITITADGGCDYLSVDTEVMVDITVYPNPATSVLTILNPSNTSSLKVEMLDMNGRIVLVENKALFNATEATIAIDNLERGIYTLRVYNNEGQKSFKIVKQ
ncbi:T9SS type A sorting domain-containing protein, partial [Brumimicrobium mesophilum]|uniref:T9SS type A sorting domain-containing protein n=1 Tax=Brumimicrobium mesophilum TaxID=392717 RepID=UPI00131D0090